MTGKTEVEKFRITKVRFDSNKQLSAIGTCLSCGFERALITSERFEVEEEQTGFIGYDENWRCWCPKCDHSYWEGEGRIERTDTDKVATFLYGRGEYFKTKQNERTKVWETVAQTCWICGGPLKEGNAIWPSYCHPWLGLHIQCAPKRLSENFSVIPCPIDKG